MLRFILPPKILDLFRSWSKKGLENPPWLGRQWKKIPKTGRFVILLLRCSKLKQCRRYPTVTPLVDSLIFGTPKNFHRSPARRTKQSPRIRSEIPVQPSGFISWGETLVLDLIVGFLSLVPPWGILLTLLVSGLVLPYFSVFSVSPSPYCFVFFLCPFVRQM